MSVAGRENISPIILAHTITICICTRLQRMIAAENSTACEGHGSTRRAGANNVISPTGECKSNDGLMNQDHTKDFKNGT